MITARAPEDWQALEDAVERILTRSGLDAERARTVETVRGTVEVDVFATQGVGHREFAIACECKHWSSAVDQQIVHGFRTIMGDMGADRGYIISTGGFQSGAREAAAYSSITLVTWQEFQAEFEPDYFESYVRARLDECVGCLSSFCEPISPGTFLVSGELPESNIDAFMALKERYSDLTLVCLPFFEGMPRLKGPERLKLPLRQYLFRGAKVSFPEHLSDIGTWDELLKELCQWGEQGYQQFRALLHE